jgi:multiple sugar transport system permease protein
VIFVTLLTLALLFLFLSPFAYMLLTAFMPVEQWSIPGAPIYPASIESFEYEGKKLEVYNVPQPDGSLKEMAALKKTNKQTTFIDPKPTPNRTWGRPGARWKDRGNYTTLQFR